MLVLKHCCNTTVKTVNNLKYFFDYNTLSFWKSALAAFLSMSWSLPRVPHQMPASLAWSLGCRLLRKWTRWVEMGSSTDSGGTWRYVCRYLVDIV